MADPVVADPPAAPLSRTLETRREQMFPRLEPSEIQRLVRFGDPRTFAAGEFLARVGKPGLGLIALLSGTVAITQRVAGGKSLPIVVHEAGSFLGELAQLSGRPSLVDAQATSPVEALLITPRSLRALLIAEADLGQKIMRALILRLEGFLSRNGHPFTWLDSDNDPCGRTLIEQFEIAAEQLPITLCPSGQLLHNPGESALARCLGLVKAIDPARVYDVVVVGAGPAGLASSVYAASDGLEVLTLDCRAFGGQTGASARIENFLGFPTGISGLALMARSYNQAQKFGVEFAIPDEAVRLECPTGAGCHTLTLANGEVARARAVVIATGARYRRLPVENIDRFEGASLHYWASPIEARLSTGQPAALVGGGNSAGQAAVFLAGHASRVILIARRPLAQTMSHYLVERIASQANIEVHEGAEVEALEGKGSALEAIRWRRRGEAKSQRLPVRQLFLFIGADPNTDWLAGTGIKLDRDGFVITGGEAATDRLPLESSRPGIFAVGDVRAQSVKRVAAAAGDGALAVASIHTLFQRREAEHS